MEPVKAKRRYDSSRRQAQAAATRGDILDAARRRFERDGYAATSMDAIAAEAGVALKTVYVAFGTKSGLLRALWNHLLRDGRDDTPVAGQSWYREVVDEPDPERQLRRAFRASLAVKLRIADVLEVIRGAALLDAEVAALWGRIQTEFHANQRVIVESLETKHALAPGLDVDDATDVLWTINHPNVWQLLVGERGWTPDRWERWSADLACAQLLGHPTPPPP
jgi:AcrR family transcriptional regulator